MYYGQFAKTIKGSDVVNSIRSYNHLIEKHQDDSITINGELSEFKSLEEAREYIKTKIFSEKLEAQISNDTYEELSENRIAQIIKDNHDIKVTDTLIESYIDLASSKLFTVDPVVYEIRKLNKLDVVVENKMHYELNDGTTVAISKDTQETLNKLLQSHTDVVEHMRESKDNFLRVVEQIKE
jgi:predicted RNA-binding protein YlxR (DUF448 family)